MLLGPQPSLWVILTMGGTGVHGRAPGGLRAWRPRHSCVHPVPPLTHEKHRGKWGAKHLKGVRGKPGEAGWLRAQRQWGPRHRNLTWHRAEVGPTVQCVRSEVPRQGFGLRVPGTQASAWSLTFSTGCRALRVSHSLPVPSWRPQGCPGTGQSVHLGDPHLTLEGAWGPGWAGHRSRWGLYPQNLCAGTVE